MEFNDIQNKWEFHFATLYFKGVTKDEVYNQFNSSEEHTEKTIEVIKFDKKIIDTLKNDFPVLQIHVGEYNHYYLGIPNEKYSKIVEICQNSSLNDYIPHIALIIYFACKIKFKNKGEKSKELEGLVKLKDKLSQTYIHKVGKYNDYEVTESPPKYSIQELKIVIKDETPGLESIKSETIKIVIGDNNQGGSLSGIIHQELNTILEKYVPSTMPEKVNTNQQFCQQFFKFIDTQTPFSISNQIPERQILSLFVDIYESSGNKLPKTSDKVELVEKWYKPTSK